MFVMLFGPVVGAALTAGLLIWGLMDFFGALASFGTVGLIAATYLYYLGSCQMDKYRMWKFKRANWKRLDAKYRRLHA